MDRLDLNGPEGVVGSEANSLDSNNKVSGHNEDEFHEFLRDQFPLDFNAVSSAEHQDIGDNKDEEG